MKVKQEVAAILGHIWLQRLCCEVGEAVDGRLTMEVDRPRRGEFDIADDLPRDGELGDLASQVHLLGQQLSDTTQLQHVIDYLEDGIIFFFNQNKLHDGLMDVVSQVGRGTGVIVQLPVR